MNGVVYVGSKDHYFYALNAASGKVKWSTELGKPVFDEAIVRSQVLVVYGVGLGPAPQVIFVLDYRDGRIEWSTEGKGSATYPALRENVIYFGSEAKDVYYDQEKRYFSLNAVDLGTGRPHWTIQLNGQRPGTPVLSMDILYVAAFEGGAIIKSAKGGVEFAPTVGHVYAVDPSTGKLLWDYNAGEVKAFASPPLTVGPKHLFLVTEEGLSAVRKSSGELGWFLEGNYYPLIVQLHDVLYLNSDPFARKESIFAIDRDRGTIIWRASPGKKLFLRSITDNAVYVSVETSLVALGRSDGKKLWSFKTGGTFRKGTNISAPPTRFGRQIIFPTKTNLIWGEAPIKGHLYSIDAETGKLE